MWEILTQEEPFGDTIFFSELETQIENVPLFAFRFCFHL
jgi:hypothetical protein